MSEARRAAEERRTVPPTVESLDETQRQRRARIVEAAIELMLATDYERIQMKDVSAIAGVALGTTYRYFASKEQLLAEALVAWSDRFPAFEGTVQPGRSVDQLKKAFRRAARAFEPHPTVYGTILVLQATTDPLVVPLYDRFAVSRQQAFARYLPDIPSPRRERIVDVMAAVLDVNLRAWALGRRPMQSVYTALDSAAELLLGGEAGEPGAV